MTKGTPREKKRKNEGNGDLEGRYTPPLTASLLTGCSVVEKPPATRLARLLRLYCPRNSPGKSKKKVFTLILMNI